MWFLLAALSPDLAAAQEGRGYLELSGGSMTGDFGTTTTSRLSTLAATAGYVDPQYDVSITVPCLTLTNETGGFKSTESGLGDIILRGGIVIIPARVDGFSVTGSIAVKLPTADETKALGTGATDYGAFLGLHRRFDTMRVTLRGGYIIVGDSPSVNYRDVYLYGAGFAKIFGMNEVVLSLEGRRSAFPAEENPREIHAGFFHVLSRDYSVKARTFVGLNDGGPDSGIHLSIIRWL
jgi:hypothetical protein